MSASILDPPRPLQGFQHATLDSRMDEMDNLDRLSNWMDDYRVWYNSVRGQVWSDGGHASEAASSHKEIRP